MKNNMKKLVLVLVLIFASLICMGQSKSTQMIQKKANHVYNEIEEVAFHIPNPDTLILVNVTDNKPDELTNGWALLGRPCAGCASYFYKILRTKETVLGEDQKPYYYFYFYFYSNSFLENKTPAGTYLSGVNILIDDSIAFDIPYILLEPSQVVYAAWVRSTSPFSQISFKPTKVTVH